MLKNDKHIFLLSCFGIFLVNGYLYSEKGSGLNIIFGSALGGSLVSIPIWSAIGVIVSSVLYFFYKIAKPDAVIQFTKWHEASIGLLLGIILKIMLGILW